MAIKKELYRWQPDCFYFCVSFYYSLLGLFLFTFVDSNKVLIRAFCIIIFG
jgi:hypothetical protein